MPSFPSKEQSGDLLAGLVGGLVAVASLTTLYSPNSQASPTQFIIFGQVIHHIYWGIYGLVAGSLLFATFYNRSVQWPRLLGSGLLVAGFIYFGDDIWQHFGLGSPFVLKAALALIIRSLVGGFV